jgi:hypothetical protein
MKRKQLKKRYLPHKQNWTRSLMQMRAKKKINQKRKMNK